MVADVAIKRIPWNGTDGRAPATKSPWRAGGVNPLVFVPFGFHCNAGETKKAIAQSVASRIFAPPTRSELKTTCEKPRIG
jgi:hypothetical protein